VSWAEDTTFWHSLLLLLILLVLLLVLLLLLLLLVVVVVVVVGRTQFCRMKGRLFAGRSERPTRKKSPRKRGSCWQRGALREVA